MATEMVLGSEVVPRLRDLSIELHKIDRDILTKKDREIAKAYFREELTEFYQSASFTRRALDKPLGYAGDYVMMQQIYEDSFEGSSLFGKLIHKWGINETSSLSVRYRRNYLKEQIRQLKGDHIVVGSVACGPAREIIDFLNEVAPEESGRYTFILMDQDKTALLSAKHAISNIRFERKLETEVLFVPLSVKGILENSEVAKQMRSMEFDLIYTAGLYDYLTQPVAKLLTANLFSWVRQAGMLIVGNFHPNNPTHTISEFATEWSLIHRTDEEMIDLVAGLNVRSKNVHKDELEIDLFLEAVKA